MQQFGYKKYFQQYVSVLNGCQFYWWRKSDYSETTD